MTTRHHLAQATQTTPDTLPDMIPLRQALEAIAAARYHCYLETAKRMLG